MQTSIKQITPVDYELSVEVTADELAPKIESKLREQRSNIALKGFRKGKVPLGLLKQMFGESLVIDVVEKSVLQVYQDEVVDAGEHQVVGYPKISEFDYKLDGDLHAVMKFGVRPKIEIGDISGEKVMKLVHEVEEEDVDEEIYNFRLREAELKPREEGGIEETDYVAVDMQVLDPVTMTPIVGEKEDDAVFFMDDDQVKDELRKALMGKKADDTFQVHLPEFQEEKNEGSKVSSDLLVIPGQESSKAGPTQPFQIYVKSVQERTLPELDEAFIKKITHDDAEDEAGLREHMKKVMENTWERESRKLLESVLISRMVEAHNFPVPNSAIELLLSAYIEDIAKRNDDKLPEGFDVNAFKEANRDDAEQQAKWQLFREALIEQENLEVDDEDRDAFFLKLSDEKEDQAESMRKYYEAIPSLMDSLNNQLLSNKVFDWLEEKVTIEPKTKDEYLKALEEQEERRSALEI